MRPMLTGKGFPTGEQMAATDSGSALSQRSVTHSVSLTKVSSRETLASGTLQIVIPASDVGSLEDEMEVSASPPRLPNVQGSTNDLMNEAVTTAVLHRQQAEDQAAASSPCSQEGKVTIRPSLGTGQDLGPLETICPESGKSAETNSTGTKHRVGQNALVPVETHTWEEMDGAVWQGARGTLGGAMGYTLAVLDQMQTDVAERF